MAGSNLPEKPFEGVDFFTSIRTEMATNRGMFAGFDGVLHYACMDASFYRLKIFKKTGDVRFTAAAATQAPADARVIANGQWFDTDYCEQPCSDIPWHGEIVVNSVKEEPKPLHKFGNDKWYFGQFIGRSERAFKIGAGYPSKQADVIWDGLFPLNAVVVNKKRASLGSLAAQWHGKGRILYGIHRASDIVFVLAMEDFSPISGMDVPALAARLISMGVDDAVLGDGGSSVTLLVDRNVEVEPREEKDNTCRVGPMFRLQTLETEVGNSALTATKASSEPFPAETVLNGVDARFTQTNSGIELTILSFGISSSVGQTEIFGLGPPVVLNSSSSRLTVPASGPPLQFTGSNALNRNALASIVFTPEKDSGGGIGGTITVNTSAGKKAVFDVDWTLVP